MTGAQVNLLSVNGTQKASAGNTQAVQDKQENQGNVINDFSTYMSKSATDLYAKQQDVQNTISTSNLSTGSSKTSDYAGVSGQNSQTTGTADKSTNQDTTYNTIQNGSTRKITQADDSKNTNGISEKLQKAADDVKTAVEEDLGVTDEQLEQAMETLGLTAMDLLDPQKLNNLAVQLTGSDDMTALLTNEGFQQLLSDVSSITSQVMQETGLSKNDFAQAVTQQLLQPVDENTSLTPEEQNFISQATEMKNQDTAVNAQTQAQNDSGTVSNQPTAENNTPVITDQEQKMAPETAVTQTKTSETKQNPADEAQIQNQGSQKTGEDDSQQILVKNTESDAQTNDETGSESMMEDNSDKTDLTEKNQTKTENQPQTQVTTDGTQVVRTTEIPVGNGQTVTQTVSYVDTESLMNQISQFSKMYSSGDATTLEMQLNPENLGKLVLHVTSKGGNINAQITATNEQVKDTLQNQMAELKNVLNQQGLKVDAVEVTVETHEFEQNLDGNTSAGGQMNQQNSQNQSQARETGRRNINMNQLDGLSGLMTEEETLAAQIMKDNGNSVDFTA